MIISSNRSPSFQEFKNFIEAATYRLNEDALKRSAYYLKRNAQLLEDDVKEALEITAEEIEYKIFKGTIKKISGQRFPDIVAGKYYGIEVKSSKDEKWITLGGSVNESTRVECVERIFLMFGKLIEPVEFRSRPYEECLSEVVVTHYPRYKIDMNLSKGNTIFDKMKTTYDDLRLSGDPAIKIVEYYKGQLRKGESLWWTGKAVDNESIEQVPIKVRLWSVLSTDEKGQLTSIGFALFPDLLSKSKNKYERFSLWLVANYGVVPNRDPFSAGGVVTIETAKASFDKLPHVWVNISKYKNEIILNILKSEESVLLETWGVNEISKDRISQWIDIVANLCVLENYEVRDVLNAIFNIA
ncbi:MAG: hypothetical protein FWC47_17335 [Oscillospiraceae bacterium]|nr:hypothetical protein [Oscillospiraceae bacterium]